MNIESLLPFFVLFGVFVFAFLLEALVLYFFKLKRFWPAFGVSVLVNIVSLAAVYFLASAFLGLLGYQVGNFNGLNPPVQVAAFLWWFSVVVEGLLLLVFLRRQERSKVLLAAIVMNWLSFLLLYFFIINSH